MFEEAIMALADNAPDDPSYHHTLASLSKVGWVTGVDGEGNPLVDFPGSAGPIRARSIVALDASTLQNAAATRQGAVLIFEEGDERLPILLGLLHKPSTTPILDTLLSERLPRDETEATLDGKRVVLEGKDEIVLRCGQSSITLRRNGKVLIRGVQVETQAVGTNRIKGGSVQIN
jgi:hypothetical protein